MCFEKYVKQKYNKKNWVPLLDILWKITDGSIYWDDWASKICELIPENILEFKEYRSENFQEITYDEYLFFTGLYKDTDNDLNLILKSIYDIEETYAFSNIDDNNKEAIEYILKILTILKKNNINEPNHEDILFSKFSENNGRGNNFDGKNFSLFLK